MSIERMLRAWFAACVVVLVVAVVYGGVATAQSTTGTVVHGGDLAATLIQWALVAFGVPIASIVVAIVYKILGWFNIQVTDAQKSQLQAIVVNGVNTAAEKAKTSLRDSAALDVNVKSQVIADAVAYVQAHGADTIRALGMDPQSGQAVEAIHARIATAIADPKTPTDPSVTPPEIVKTGGAQ